MEKTILIVDDSESIRDVVNFTLENAGYKVLIGVDGRDALKHLNGTDIHLVITDFHMPHMDGIGLIKEIRAKETYQYVPILLLTTESQTAKKEEAKSEARGPAGLVAGGQASLLFKRPRWFWACHLATARVAKLFELRSLGSAWSLPLQLIPRIGFELRSSCSLLTFG